MPDLAQPPAIEELVSAGPGSVPLRIHAPADRPAAGVVLEIHGGGFYLGSAASNDVRNRRLAEVLGVVVASVDYRLAPEPPWPAALSDSQPAQRWPSPRFSDCGIAGSDQSMPPCCSSGPTT